MVSTLSHLDALQRFVDKHCLNGSKTGREEYVRFVPLSDLEELRVAVAGAKEQLADTQSELREKARMYDELCR